MLSSPALHDEHGGGFAVLGGALFTGPALISVALEWAILARSDRWDRRPVLAASSAAMALGALGVAAAHHPLALAVALGLWGAAAGVASGVGQAALVADAADPDRAMTRWGLLATLGDLCGPLAIAGAAALGFGWREAIAASALVPALDAALVSLGPPLRGSAADDEVEPLREALARAVTDAPLLAWLLAAASCTLLDEIVVSLATIRGAGLGEDPTRIGVEMFAFAAGGAVALVAVDRLLAGSSARSVLIGASALTAAAFVAWLAVGASWLAVPLLAVVGAGVAPMHPLTTAAAYARRPDRPGLVGALGQAFTVLDLAAPVAIGWIADARGIDAALLALLAQPLAVGLIAAALPRARGTVAR